MNYSLQLVFQISEHNVYAKINNSLTSIVCDNIVLETFRFSKLGNLHNNF